MNLLLLPTDLEILSEIKQISGITVVISFIILLLVFLAVILPKLKDKFNGENDETFYLELLGNREGKTMSVIIAGVIRTFPIKNWYKVLEYSDGVIFTGYVIEGEYVIVDIVQDNDVCDSFMNHLIELPEGKLDQNVVDKTSSLSESDEKAFQQLREINLFG